MLLGISQDKRSICNPAPALSMTSEHVLYRPQLIHKLSGCIETPKLQLSCPKLNSLPKALTLRLQAPNRIRKDTSNVPRPARASSSNAASWFQDASKELCRLLRPGSRVEGFAFIVDLGSLGFRVSPFGLGLDGGFDFGAG